MNDFEKLLNKTGEIGYVTQVIDIIVYAEGLPGAKPNEIVVFESGEMGQILSLAPDVIEILTFSRNSVKVGAKLARTDSVLTMPVGEDLLGKVLDPFGNSLSDLSKTKN